MCCSQEGVTIVDRKVGAPESSYRSVEDSEFLISVPESATEKVPAVC
jgi:hypothetical protein